MIKEPKKHVEPTDPDPQHHIFKELWKCIFKNKKIKKPRKNLAL
jgi:hypothetical protein